MAQRRKKRITNPFKYGCIVDCDFFCPCPVLEKELRRLVDILYESNGRYRFMNPFFAAWIRSA